MLNVLHKPDMVLLPTSVLNGCAAWRLGKDPKRHKVHSSMYANLRTNLPREVMAYTDFPFDDLNGQSQDSRRFPSHAEVSHSTCRGSNVMCSKDYSAFTLLGNAVDFSVQGACQLCKLTR